MRSTFASNARLRERLCYRALVMGAVLAAAWGCQTTIKGHFDADPSASFQSYRTFAWISENPMIIAQAANPPSPLLQGQIQQAIQGAMSARGFALVNDPEAADLAIAFTVGSREQIRVDSYPSAYRGRYGWGGGYYGYGGTDVSVRQYTEGRLAIDVFDVRRHEPVWHGWAEKRITTTDRENPQPVIREIVEAVMANFPPPVRSS